MIREGGIRVPLMIRALGEHPRQGIESTLVYTVDFYPTLLDMADLNMPHGQQVDGISLAPIISGTSELVERDLFFHWPYYLGNQVTIQGSREGEWGNRPNATVRSGKYKFSYYYDGTEPELYDLEKDIGEMHNLAKEMPELSEELEQRAIEWAQSVAGDYLPKPNKAYQNGYGVTIRNVTEVWVPYNGTIKLSDHSLDFKAEKLEAFMRTFNSTIDAKQPLRMVLDVASENGFGGHIEWTDRRGNKVISQGISVEPNTDPAELIIDWPENQLTRFFSELQISFDQPDDADLRLFRMRLYGLMNEQELADFNYGLADTLEWKRFTN